MENFFKNGRFFFKQQGSILSAAFIILSLIATSRILGLIRQRVFVHFFTDKELAVYLAALRLPETLFEILVAGSLASAFIPVFTSVISRGEKRRAWNIANTTQTILILFFLLFSILVFVFANPLSQLLTPGFSDSQQELMASLTRFLLVAQFFFLLSFFLSALQESFQHFLVPSVAPLFYNLGMIFGAAFLSGFGVWGIAVGAVVGSALQFVIQLPFVYRLGFRLSIKFNLRDKDLIKIIKLALPRVFEIVVLQIAKSVELFLATTISVAAYTHFIFANTLQLLPVALFGYSLGKASFPTLSHYAASGKKEEFVKTLNFTLGQIIFFILPAAVFLMVLRIPLVRIAFGAQRFSWEATVQTGLALSAFSIGVVAQAIISVVARSFYAFQDTKTPMFVAISSISLNIILSFFFILGMKLDVWGLAFSYSIASIFQAILLVVLLNKRIFFLNLNFLGNLMKISISSIVSGGVMYFLLKILDQAVWDKRLSFLGDVGLALPASFQTFVLDTRYAANLIFLTLFVVMAGLFVYLAIAALLRCREIESLSRWLSQTMEPVPIPKTGEKSEIPAPLPTGG